MNVTHQEIEKRAAELVEKSHAKLTKEEAIAEVVEEDLNFTRGT